jgi:hypothetical protein
MFLFGCALKGHDFSRAEEWQKMEWTLAPEECSGLGQEPSSFQNKIPAAAVVVGKLESAFQLFNFSIALREF